MGRRAYRPGRPAVLRASWPSVAAADATQALSSFNLDLDGLKVRSVGVDKRRAVDVPAEGGELTFQVTRRIEPGFDFMMVEARPEGTDEWTTLPDQNGHTSWETGFACPDLVRMHPFLEHYLTRGRGGCSTHGSTGRWWAVTGESKGYERWVLDLSRYAGQTVHLSISYVTDLSVELQGLFVDDVDVPGQDGDTSFEDDSDPLDGWMVKGSPPGSPPNPNQWTLGTAKDAPPPNGVVAQRSFAKQDDIIRFLSRRFGQYPFRTAGGIVDDREIFFALENQTRPVYGPVFFFSQPDGDLVVVHELAHQWFGDSLRVRRWRHIWLNEGFATYAEWLWQERRGQVTVRRQFRDWMSMPAGDPFWGLRIGDPGRRHMFDFPVYVRGAMTLHRIRQRVGDQDFFRILHRWYTSNAGHTVTTAQFKRLAERVSGEQLDRLFRVWLFTPRKPGARRSGSEPRGLVAPPANRPRLLRHLGPH